MSSCHSSSGCTDPPEPDLKIEHAFTKSTEPAGAAFKTSVNTSALPADTAVAVPSSSRQRRAALWARLFLVTTSQIEHQAGTSPLPKPP